MISLQEHLTSDDAQTRHRGTLLLAEVRRSAAPSPAMQGPPCHPAPPPPHPRPTPRHATQVAREAAAALEPNPLAQLATFFQSRLSDWCVPAVA